MSLFSRTAIFSESLRPGGLDFRHAAGSHFLLDTATLSILSYYRDLPAVKRWNAMLVT